MDKYLKDFLEALDNNTAFGYIAQHYMEFTKAELKDIILECLHCIDTKDGDFKSIKDELEIGWDFDESDDYASNMPCDNSGYCAGISCPRFRECNS